MEADSVLVLDATGVEECIRRLAGEIAGDAAAGPPVLVGIHTRGVHVAARLHALLGGRIAGLAALGSLDIALYRDDIDGRGSVPVLRSTTLPAAIDGARVVLCDDVLFTGRTIRAAMDVLMDHGRPAKVELAVLVDRGGNRELPIQADYRGIVLPTHRSQHVAVRLREADGEDAVRVSPTPAIES